MEVENCLPFEFARDAHNGLPLHVIATCGGGGDVCKGRVLRYAYARHLSQEECVCYGARPRPGRSMGSYGGCDPPDLPLVLVPPDELRPSNDSRDGFEVTRAEIGNRFWYLGLVRGDRLTMVNGGARASVGMAEELLRGPLAVLGRVDVVRRSSPLRIVYVDRKILTSLRAMFARVAAGRSLPTKRCRGSFVTIDPRLTDKDRVRFDRSCVDPVTERLNAFIGEAMNAAAKPRRRPMSPLTCEELAANPPSFVVNAGVDSVELRDIDWWKDGSIPR
jgi:hypothetical protein